MTKIEKFRLEGVLPVSEYMKFEDLKETSVAEWAEKYAAAKAAAIPSEIYDQLMILVKQENEIGPDHEMFNSPLFKIMEHRIQKTPLTINLTPAAKIAIGVLTQAPTPMVMMLAFLQWANSQNPVEKITTLELITTFLGMKQVAPHETGKLWDAQKVNNGEYTSNMLDYMEPYKSVIVKNEESETGN